MKRRVIVKMRKSAIFRRCLNYVGCTVILDHVHDNSDSIIEKPSMSEERRWVDAALLAKGQPERRRRR